MTSPTLLLLTIVIVAWLTAAATAVRTVSRIWLRHWVEQQLSGSGVAQLYLDRPQRLLLASGTGVALTVFTGGILLALGSRHSAPMLAVEALTYAVVLLVFGQLIPRAIARRWASALIPVLLPPLQFVDMLLRPVLWLVRRLTGEVHREAGEAPETEEEALEELLREGELEGVGEAGEIAIISGVMQFSEKHVRDVMTPRTDIVAVQETLDPADLAQRVASSGYSRVPIYRDSLDQVIGMVRVFDVLKNGGKSAPPIRPIAFARPTMLAKELLSSMLRERKHLALVREAGGPVLGLVTLEDLLEELVGDIRDEHDEPPAGTHAATRPSEQRAPART